MILKVYKIKVCFFLHSLEENLQIKCGFIKSISVFVSSELGFMLCIRIFYASTLYECSGIFLSHIQNTTSLVLFQLAQLLMYFAEGTLWLFITQQQFWICSLNNFNSHCAKSTLTGPNRKKYTSLELCLLLMIRI